MIALLEDYPLPKVDDLRFVGPAESYEAKKTAFLKMLGELKPGITQIAFSRGDRVGCVAADRAERGGPGLELRN